MRRALGFEKKSDLCHWVVAICLVNETPVSSKIQKWELLDSPKVRVAKLKQLQFPTFLVNLIKEFECEGKIPRDSSIYWPQYGY